MEKREKEHRQSSLPLSLIPHLYVRPQLPRDSSTRTTLTASPMPDDEDEEQNAQADSLLELPAPSFPLRPITPSLTQEFALSPRRAFSGKLEDPRTRTSGLPVPPVPLADQRSVGPSSIPHGPAQSYAGPIYSDPVYHTARHQANPYTTRSYTFPPPAHPDQVTLPGLWREGEAGPSSMVHSQAHGTDLNFRGRRETSYHSPRGASSVDALGPPDNLEGMGAPQRTFVTTLLFSPCLLRIFANFFYNSGSTPIAAL